MSQIIRRRHSHLIHDSSDVVKASSTYKPTTYSSRFRNESKVTGVTSEWSIDLYEGYPVVTVKALVAGCLVGILCSFLALYYSLKTGVVPSLNILSGLGGFLLVKFFLRLRIFRGHFTPQENAVVQTVAVALYAMSSVGLGFGSSYLGMSENAYLGLGGDALSGNRIEDTVELAWWRNLLWLLALGLFGFMLAYPLRNYTILKQKLPFPSGTVTAYVIKNMHSGSSDSTKAAFALLSKFFSLGFCINLFTWVFDGLDSFPIFGMNMMTTFHWLIDWDLGTFGIGAILPMQVNASMLLGAFITYGILQPLIYSYRNGAGPDHWLDLDNLPGGSSTLGLQWYAISAGLAIMLVTGVYTILNLIWVLVQGFRERRNKGKNGADDDDDTDGIQGQVEVLNRIFLTSRVPVWVPLGGYLAFSVFTMLLLHFLFNVQWYMTLVALTVVPLFAISNVQGMGRTDWDVASSYGKLMMFPFGAWNFGKSIIPSLALCVVTTSGCSNAASLLQDFKTGYLLGASPNSMFIAQFFGAVVGAFVTPTLFLLLTSTYTLPNPDGSAFLQGMYGLIYRALAVVAAGSGFGALPKNWQWIALGFGIFALILCLLQTFAPEKYQRYIPDPSAISIGVIVPPVVSLEFFIGGAIVWWWTKWNPSAKEKVPYIASGAVAGSGLGVVGRCILSLFDLRPPITIDWAEDVQKLDGGKWFGMLLFIIIFIAVLLCGFWYWNQDGEVVQEPGEEEKGEETELQLTSGYMEGVAESENEKAVK